MHASSSTSSHAPSLCSCPQLTWERLPLSLHPPTRLRSILNSRVMRSTLTFHHLSSPWYPTKRRIPHEVTAQNYLNPVCPLPVTVHFKSLRSHSPSRRPLLDVNVVGTVSKYAYRSSIVPSSGRHIFTQPSTTWTLILTCT